MPRPLLYSYRRCPYAMRARMALLQAGIEFEVHEISLRDKPPAMLELSPKGTVPVMLLPDGRVIDESLDIMRWALEGSDPGGWWQRAQSSNCRAWVETNDGPFKQLLDRYKYPERHPSGEGQVFHRSEAVKCLLRPLDQQLGVHAFLGGDQPCAADIAIFPFARQFRAVDAAWFDAQDLAALQRWLQHWLGSALFERCMKKPAKPAATNPA